MHYFQVKSDHRFMKVFRDSVAVLWNFEASASNQIDWSTAWMAGSTTQSLLQSAASKLKGYQEQRENVASKIPQAITIADRYDVPIYVQSFPPVAVGGPVISVNLFQAILSDDSWGGFQGSG